MLDPVRIAARLAHWSAAGHPVVRIWLTSEDVIAFKTAQYRDAADLSQIDPSRFCGVPISLCDGAPSRVVFETGESASWSVVCRRGID